MDPLVSVVIPTRHRNDLLAQCLDRLAPGVQTLPADRYEVIVTDDGSNETAEDLIRATYPWARWVAGPRRGPAANRNSGAAHARGEWLAFTDDDCLPEPGWLAAYAAALTGGADVYEGKTTCRDGLRSPRMHAPVNLVGGCLWSCNLLIRRQVFGRFQFDESFPQPHMEDVYLRHRLEAAGVGYHFVPAAEVDHPPRRLPGPKRISALHECDVILHYKLGNACPPLWRHLLQVFRSRVHRIRSHRLGLESAGFFVDTLCELYFVARQYEGWRRAHGPQKTS